jgi:hypothetical protein
MCAKSSAIWCRQSGHFGPRPLRGSRRISRPKARSPAISVAESRRRCLSGKPKCSAGALATRSASSRCFGPLFALVPTVSRVEYRHGSLASRRPGEHAASRLREARKRPGSAGPLSCALGLARRRHSRQKSLNRFGARAAYMGRACLTPLPELGHLRCIPSMAGRDTSVTAITVPDISAGSSWFITVWTVCTELPGNGSPMLRSPHQMDVHNRKSPRQNGPRLPRTNRRQTTRLPRCNEITASERQRNATGPASDGAGR